jgi:hypothetical protein
VTDSQQPEREWLWYFSQDEERWCGGHANRQDAIDEGIETYGGDPFLVCRARRRKIDFEIGAYRLVEALEDHNHEALDPDGDGLFPKLTRGQGAHLSHVVGEAIRNWADYWGLAVADAWAFAETRDQETIFATAAYDEHRRRYWHMQVAQMGFRARFDWEWNKLFKLYPRTKSIVGRCESFLDAGKEQADE